VEDREREFNHGTHGIHGREKGWCGRVWVWECVRGEVDREREFNHGTHGIHGREKGCGTGDREIEINHERERVCVGVG
jgi:hypothetical protein